MTAEPSLITVSASYGAGGSVVAPALAGRLGLPFLQRVTTSEGHLAQPGPCDEQLSMEEVKATPVHRLLGHFTQAMPAGPTQSPPSTHHQDEHLRGHSEAGIHRLLAAAGGGVILGRAAAVVLGKDRGFHVRLDGPAGRRAAQGADPPRLHGPYWQWTRKVAARTICRWLSKEQHDDYQAWIDNDRRLRELLARLEALGAAALEADPRLRRQRRSPPDRAR